MKYMSSYWEPTISPEKYSFVDNVVGKGYSIFFYDRLGVGASTKISGYLNQATIQVAILQELAKLVKSGKYTGSVGKPKKLVLVGHSFGSGITAAAATAQPGIADGLVLTGFSYNGSNPTGTTEALDPRIASGQDPKKWSGLDSVSRIPAIVVICAFLSELCDLEFECL
jgi:pimeloyl-ACP methyl ester carboxylesterase